MLKSKGGLGSVKNLSLGVNRGGKILAFEGPALYRTAFVLGFLLLILTLLPLLIFNGGIFTYYGDFNSQQLPFNQMVHDSVQNGELLWNWKTDLGASLVGSYAFYLLGSPFFWLTTIFPSKAVPYLIPILLGLKYGVATLTATAWMRRFCKRGETALMGALLYAFSSFQGYNIFFNHFHDVTAFFPLLLLTMDMAVEDKKPHYFGFAVALMAMVNYYFFTGQVVFCVGYFLLRWLIGDWGEKVDLKTFGALVLQGVLGVMAAGVILLPAVTALLGNPRTGERLLGNSLIMYSDITRIPRGIFSTVMIGDIPARSVLFPSDSAKWSSIAAYLPMFSIAGVIAFMRAKPGHWAKKLVLFAALTFIIPAFSSLFSGLTSSVNGRWFYMPILVMAMMTAVAYEEEMGVFKALKSVSLMILAFGVIALLPKTNGETGKIQWGDYANEPVFFWIFLLVTSLLALLACIPIKEESSKNHSGADVEKTIAGASSAGGAAVKYKHLRLPFRSILDSALIRKNYSGADEEGTIAGRNPCRGKFRLRGATLKVQSKTSARHGIMLKRVALAALVTQCTIVWCGVSLGNWPPEYIEHAIRGGENITLPNGDLPLEKSGSNFFRVDISEDKDNYPMFWGYANMRAFQSTVPPSIMEFYNSVGITRDVASRAGTEAYGLRGLFSVKYYFDWVKSNSREVIQEEKTVTAPVEGIMPGFKYVDTQNNFNIYENENYVPMGFSYPGIISRETYDKLSVGSKHLALLKGLVLEAEDFEQYKNELPIIEKSELSKTFETDYIRDCEVLRASGVENFSYSTKGFKAETDLTHSNLVFFSVPYDPGFTAHLDGEEVPIIKSNVGFMAIAVPAGSHTIEFTFLPKGLKLGLILSVTGLLVLAMLAGASRTGSPIKRVRICSFGVRSRLKKRTHPTETLRG